MGKAKHGQQGRQYRSRLESYTEGNIVPLPDGKNWSDIVDCISVPGRVVEIDDRIYWHYLEVLRLFEPRKPPASFFTSRCLLREFPNCDLDELLPRHFADRFVEGPKMSDKEDDCQRSERSISATH